MSSLQSEGYEVEVDELIPYCLHLKGHPIIESSNFKNGNISIQDKSSMFVGYLMGVEENDVILDACSAPGGKASHSRSYWRQVVTWMPQISISIKLV